MTVEGSSATRPRTATSPGADTSTQPIVGMVADARWQGLLEVASDGGIFNFGDAALLRLHGWQAPEQPGRRHGGLSPNGRGYWLVASDGGIFSFGNVRVLRSSNGRHPPLQAGRRHGGRVRTGTATGSSPLTVGHSPSGLPPSKARWAWHSAGSRSGGGGPGSTTIVNNGYWLVSQSGTVYGFGNAGQNGSLTGWPSPATSIASSPTGGYWILTADGVVHPLGISASSPTTTPEHLPGRTKHDELGRRRWTPASPSAPRRTPPLFDN